MNKLTTVLFGTGQAPSQEKAEMTLKALRALGGKISLE